MRGTFNPPVVIKKTFRIFPLKFQNKHIKIFINFFLTSANEFCQRFKLMGRKINYLRLIISVFTLLEHMKLFYSP